MRLDMNDLRKKYNGIYKIPLYVICLILILAFCIFYVRLNVSLYDSIWTIIFLGLFPIIIFIIYFVITRTRGIPLIIFSIFSFLICFLFLGIALEGYIIGNGLVYFVFYLLYLVPIGILFSLDFSLKTGINVCLIFLNVFVLTTVIASYYFGFDLQWGFHKSALTWGSPLLLSALGILILILINIKFNKWIIGAVGCLIGFLAIAYFNILINSTDVALLDQNVNPTDNASLTEEEKIVSLILSDRNEEPDHFMVVYPSKDFHYIFGSNPQEAEEKKNEMKEFIENDPYMSGLIDKLFELNNQPYKLSLPSNLEKGYYVDYPQIFKNYIWRWNGMGFYSHRWNTYHPLADGPVSISKPYYDPETGLVLAYVEGIKFEQSQYGDVTVFSYKDGKLDQTGFLPTGFVINYY
jgi:hypothetical protein